tara:strand:- start:16910 stop:17839 length:930 start_codon:yes stop_codon:yes gene_type:complete
MIAEGIKKGPVYAIPSSFNSAEELDTEQTTKYLAFLQENGAKTIMTTAGTSQFNLLTSEEVRIFNKTCANNFDGVSILGLPPLSEKLLHKEINWVNENIPESSKVCIMLLWPDRYYNDKDIKEFFCEAAHLSKVPVLIHGMFMRNGTGGTYNFSASLVNELAKHENIIGLKEENADLSAAYKFCKEIDSSFVQIVAGGSQKRFTHLYPAGADTFLTGIGNLFPQIDEKFFEELTNNNSEKAFDMLKKFENKFFDVFMKHGWHKSLRSALKSKELCCHYNRKPFPVSGKVEKYEIDYILNLIEKRWNEYE